MKENNMKNGKQRDLDDNSEKIITKDNGAYCDDRILYGTRI